MSKFPPSPCSQVWDNLIASLPGAHFLQTAEWSQVKAQVGWKPFYLVWGTEDGKTSLYINQWPAHISVSAAALVLQRELKLGGFSARLRMLYTPKGPLLDWENESLKERVLIDLQIFARQENAIFIKIDPDVIIGHGEPGSEPIQEKSTAAAVQKYLETNGWRFSTDQVQFRNTVLLDLTGSESELLERMKQKTRYNIRLASRKGVAVRPGTAADYPQLYRMYAETAVRDGFIIRDEAYYQMVWSIFNRSPSQTLSNNPRAYPLIAEVDGEPVAALVMFAFAERAWYLYGMSRESHREKMPNYLLQWEAIRLARENGCRIYDLWGAPDTFNDTDSMWGVYRFKEGLGGQVARFLGAWDYPAHRITYRLYTQTLPRLLGLMRRKSKEKTRQFVG